MTNVKLKLMFYLLNALLSADLVHSRPYSDYNTTDFLSFNSTYNIPVETNSDTLTVANDDQTAEETNKNANTHMEEIVDAEQDRDEALSEKNIKDQVTILGIAKNEAEAFEKQLNISSPLLDEMIDSESDREGTLTDILFRPEAQLVQEPRFEFLVAKANDTGRSERNRERGGEGNSTDVLRKYEYVELVEVGSVGENRSSYVANITGHEVDNDLAPDTSFTDVQTLFLACFATLVPLLLVLFASLTLRCMLRRWCPNACAKPVESSVSESSEKQDSNHQQLKSGDGTPDSDTPPANGSVFTMTLKNNHLIVETEERNDITKNGRETKMKYSPDNEGIFVVEVQQSAAYRSNKTFSPVHDPQISTNQALIHRIPEELERKLTEEESERSSSRFESKQALALSSTGLSISDLSMSSIGSHNVSYSYGSQLGYDQGPFGYPIYAGYDTGKDVSMIHDSSQEPLIGKTPTDPDRPVITAAIFKQDSIIGNDILHGPGYCIEGSSDGPLLSDVQAREISLQHLHDRKEKKMENGVAVPVAEKIEKRESTSDDTRTMETIMEDIPNGKRTMPVITTDVYESVKESIQGGPKFEKLMNELSPGEGGCDPPVITITEDDTRPPDTS
ncbi:uncharacterized protein LOC121733120 isoform X2 [Aricia agestis]|uniref:uncharacterized protein LOC121733120 isoform X2 n=1 Tax=Aricia agestis TaxID=91739 RepID=UPI001C20521F|nr:uncharacterized protein LOC121733120 isoform X2 [Aricia agestis]